MSPAKITETREDAACDLCDDRCMTVTVLVVDDHPSFRRLARQLLESGGFAVVDEAGDGESALSSVRAFRPDVVLLDVLLPDTTGFELAETLSASPRPPVVVLTSSRTAADFGPRLQQSSARGFIAKRDLTLSAFTELLEGAA